MMSSLAKMLRRKDLIWFLAVLDIKAGHRATLLGVLWSLLDPFFKMLDYLFLFGLIFKTRTPNFALHLLLALVPFKFTQTGILQASQSLVRYRSLIESAGFPRMVLPLSTVLGSFIQMLFAFCILAVIGPFMGMTVGVSLVVVPLVLMYQILLTVGLGLIASVANAMYKDVSKLLPHAMRIWWYLSPGIYTLDQLPERLLPLELLNPLAAIFPAYQDIFIRGSFPHFSTWWPSLLITVVILVFALLFFTGQEGSVAKYV